MVTKSCLLLPPGIATRGFCLTRLEAVARVEWVPSREPGGGCILDNRELCCLDSGARSWPFVAILGADRRSSPLPPPWPWSPSWPGAGPSRPPPSPPGSGYRPCIDGSSGAAGAIRGSLPWPPPFRPQPRRGEPPWPIISSGQAPGDPCSPASVGSENRFPFFNGKKTGKRGSIVSKPRGSSRRSFRESVSTASSGKSSGKPSRNIPKTGAPPVPIVSRTGLPDKQVENR